MTDQKHTKGYALDAAPYQAPELSKGEIKSRVDGITKKLIEGERRSLVCVSALAGIDDPEAFMRDVRIAVYSKDYQLAGEAFTRLDEQHLKGGAE